MKLVRAVGARHHRDGELVLELGAALVAQQAHVERAGVERSDLARDELLLDLAALKAHGLGEALFEEARVEGERLLPLGGVERERRAVLGHDVAALLPDERQ